MIKLLMPMLHFKSIYDVDFSVLKNNGIRLVILDIDNTLVPHNSPSNEKVINWINSIKGEGFEVCILSNSSKKRVKMFIGNSGIFALHRGWKPLLRNYNKILTKYNVNPKNAAILGDQIFTDILGGNRLGIFTIYIDPINPHEDFLIKPKRWLEKFILKHK